MTLTASEFRKHWQQVPDQYIWRNKNTGIFISVNGTSDQGWYVVKRMNPIPKEGGFGSVSTEPVSPYYVTSNKPVGYMGTQSNQRVKEEENWRPGTFDDALNAAYRYMYMYQKKNK